MSWSTTGADVAKERRHRGAPKVTLQIAKARRAEIRALWARGAATVKQLARRFDLHLNTVKRIVGR